ncbi:MAG: hypothetical protein KGY67_00445 [Candidatus Thermoplasmatota archaeon]|nr:hypothetical protein [Candidatus Thermoplasmatota archaeon]
MNKTKLSLFLLILYILFLVIQFIRYIPDEYDCVHMSRDQEKIFESIGLNTKIIRGKTKINNEGHLWNSVELFGLNIHIDSVGWFPFIPELFYENIQKYDSFQTYKNSK